MSGFRDLVNTVVQNGSLNPFFFGETVTIAGAVFDGTPTVKISHTQDNGRHQATFDNDQTIDEVEKIEVMFSRDPTFAGCREGKPCIGETLVRAEAVDPDRRPFAFRGEIGFEGPSHSVYFYIRPKRTVAGRK